MTPGQEALIEAMRIEQARIYSQVQREHKATSTDVSTLVEAVTPRPKRRPTTRAAADPVFRALRDGVAVSEIVELYGVSYSEVRAAQKNLMRSA